MKVEWKTCLRVGISIFVLYLCILYWRNVAGVLGAVLGAAAPLLIGCGIAYVVNILMSFYERHWFPRSASALVCRTRRVTCLVLSAVTLLAVLALVIVLIVPQLVLCVQLLLAELPGALNALVDFVESLHILPEDIIKFLDSINWQSRLTQIINAVLSGIGDVAGVAVGVVSSIFSGIVTAFLSIIFAIYLLLGKDNLRRQFHRLAGHYLRPAWQEKLMYVLRVLDNSFHRYIVGQCTEAVILGMLCALGMLVLQLPYAPMVGALIAFTALIPVAGAYIGGFVGAFMIFTASPFKAVVFVVFLVILQQLEGNIIYPRVVGSSMGLPGIWVLAAVTVGGGIMGIFGMLLSVPVAAAVYQLVKADMNRPAVRPAAPEAQPPIV